jgi:predicted phosphodiesterase
MSSTITHRMRIHLLSDLHLEVAPFKATRPVADVVVLAGDIDRGIRGIGWARRAWPNLPIIYVAGNHELHRNALPSLWQKLRAEAAANNVSFLENEAVAVGSVRFLGCTLWTDFGYHGDDAAGRIVAATVMRDYRKIRVEPQYRKLTPRDTQAMHSASLRWLQSELQACRNAGIPAVVVTHHAPSSHSVAVRDLEDPATVAYASHLDEFVTRCGPAVWLHGHTHVHVDYTIGGTRVVSNARGYEPDEPVAGFEPDLVVTLESGYSSYG